MVPRAALRKAANARRSATISAVCKPVRVRAARSLAKPSGVRGLRWPTETPPGPLYGVWSVSGRSKLSGAAGHADSLTVRFSRASGGLSRKICIGVLPLPPFSGLVARNAMKAAPNPPTRRDSATSCGTKNRAAALMRGKWIAPYAQPQAGSSRIPAAASPHRRNPPAETSLSPRAVPGLCSERDSQGEKRRNENHASITDPDEGLARTSNGQASGIKVAKDARNRPAALSPSGRPLGTSQFAARVW